MGRICYLNGEYLPLAQARVSVLDRGFIFGDAVYEVIIASGGRIFALEEHLARLANSLHAVSISNPCSELEWQALLTRLVSENGAGEQAIYVQVTRGVAERDHAFPSAATPTVFAMSRALTVAGGLARVDAMVLPDNRWLRCDIKSTSLLPNVLLRNQAIAAGAYEAILVRDDIVTEGSSSNVFVVHGERVTTPPLSPYILPGVSRALLIDVLQGNGVTINEAPNNSKPTIIHTSGRRIFSICDLMAQEPEAMPLRNTVKMAANPYIVVPVKMERYFVQPTCVAIETKPVAARTITARRRYIPSSPTSARLVEPLSSVGCMADNVQ